MPLVLDDADVKVAVVDEGERGLPRDAAAGGVRPGAHRARHRQRTSSASASWTRTSRKRDGSPARLDTDLVGARKTDGRSYAAGPIATLASGSSRTRVW